jgi:hypothetical protein
MAQKKNIKTVNIRHWEQASFLPKINFPVAAQTVPPPRANGGNAPMPDSALQLLTRSVRKTGKF